MSEFDTMGGLSGFFPIHNENYRLFILIFITLLAFAANIAGLYLGLSIFTPLLFYLPIIIAAYWYPRQGVLFAVLVGILQVSLVYLFGYPTIPELTFAVTTASFYVLVAIAVVISSLSGNLKDQEARYHGIFDHSETGIFLVHNETKNLIIEETNPRAAEIVNRRPADLIGRSFSEFWANDLEKDEFLRELLRVGTITNYESSVIVGETIQIPVIMSAARLPEHMIVLTITDISERKISENEIRNRNLQLAMINRIIRLANSSQSIHDIMEGSVSLVREFLDFESGGIMLSLEQTGDPDEYQDGAKELFAQLSESWSDEATRWKDAIRNHESFVFWIPPDISQEESQEVRSGIVLPLEVDSATIGVAYFASRTSRRIMEDEITILQSVAKEVAAAVKKLRLSGDLIESNKKANLYLDILMHDINNANLASLWYGDLLTEMLDGEQKDIAKKMIAGIRKSREIIRNLETIRRIHEQREALKAVALDPVITQEIGHFPDARITYEGTSMVVWADDLLGELFTNLIGNCVKFGEPGVNISIEVSTLNNGEVLISVSDDGPGIPDEIKDVIFNRFHQNSQKGAGKGLGLYIVKTLIDRYGGTIWVENRVTGYYEKGAVFKFILKRFQDS